jgi:hypothetical protein
MAAAYNVADFEGNPSCAHNGNISRLGYSSITRSPVFTISKDVRTLITAISVNLGILEVSNLQLVESSVTTVNGTKYGAASYVDPRYPGMGPILCLEQGNKQNCLIQMGDYYSIPLFNHIGANESYPEPCVCSEANSYNDLCQRFVFLTGVIYWPMQDATPNAALELMIRKTSQEIMDLAYTPMFTASVFGQASPMRNAFNSPAQRDAMYSFCDSSTFGPCSIITFSSYDSTLSNDGWTVSTNLFRVYHGACTDTFSTSPDNW